jgi:hypothetical protein
MSPIRTEERVIRPYRPEDKPAVLDLIGKVWGEQTRRDHEIIWDWKHAWMAGDNGGYFSRVLEQNGTIVGYTGVTPCRIKAASLELTGGCGRDTFVSPENRGAGIRLMRRQLDESGFLFGAANDRTADLWIKLSQKHEDSRPLWGVSKLILMIDPTDALCKRGLPRFLGRPGKLALACLRWASMLAYRGNQKGLRLEPAAKFPPEIDSFCDEFAAGSTSMVRRDHKFLNWRYVDCPLTYNRHILWEGDRIRGYMVCRAGKIHGRRVFLINEMLATGDFRRHYGLMVRDIVRMACRDGASDIQILRSGDADLDGFLARRLFLEKREKTVIMAWINDSLGLSAKELSAMYKGNGWFLTMGDGDFEFIFFDQKPSDYIDGSHDEE